MDEEIPLDRPRKIGREAAWFGAGEQAWRLAYDLDGDTLAVHPLEDDVGPRRLVQALHAAWSTHGADRLTVPASLADRLPLALRFDGDERVEVPRAALYQVREAWLAPALHPVPPEVRVDDDVPGGTRPLRPRVPDGRLYRTYLSATDEVFELRRARVDKHGEAFHRWQNNPRVAEAWDEAGTREEHDEHLRERRQAPHIEPIVGYADGTPFAYIEVYWAPEDRIAPHVDAGPFDQGLHLLVGEDAYLGAERTRAWLRAAFQFMFLREPRTRRLVGEPAADNEAVHRRLRETGWRKDGEFDFPHKRASRMLCPRTPFFEEQRL